MVGDGVVQKNETNAVTIEMVQRLSEITGDSRLRCREGLRLRDGHIEFAEEWVKRHSLATVMSFSTRYPLWSAHLAREGRNIGTS